MSAEIFTAFLFVRMNRGRWFEYHLNAKLSSAQKRNKISLIGGSIRSVAVKYSNSYLSFSAAFNRRFALHRLFARVELLEYRRFYHPLPTPPPAGYSMKLEWWSFMWNFPFARNRFCAWRITRHEYPHGE